jgi:Tol biopolymer transport system component/predicted Ser/Thr protein kinase
MPLQSGDKLGPYEILAPIGEGGMGEVYKARDTRLDRVVALKVSKSEFSKRFEREARAVAALNHPNICTLHDVGPNYLVMEYIEGTPLKGPLPLDQALKYAAQICDALDAAHKKNITHRDLKPANILITRQGIKLLDFGLAKAGPVVKADEATMTMALTGKGQILGTLPYMSPEQINGQEADARSDIFSFGLVLYEMLIGKRTFEGSTPASVMGAILERPAPSITEVAPAALDRVLKRCLEKDPEDRWQSSRDLKAALDLVGQPALTPAAPILAAQPPARGSWLWQGVAVVLAVVAGVGLWGWLRPTPAEPRLLMHFTSATPQGIDIPIAVSRDGYRIAFQDATAKVIYLRAMDDPVAKPILGTEGGLFPVFSPDGQWLAFFSGTPGLLKKVPLAGGAALTLASNPGTLAPMTWGEDGNLLLGGSNILRIPEAGGQPVVIAKPDTGQEDHLFVSPELLPGGKYILASVLNPKDLTDLRVLAVEIATGKKKTLLDAAGETRFAPTGPAPGIGHLLYGRKGSLFAAAFNATTLQVGPAAPVLEGLRDVGGLVPFGFSHSGTLAYPGSSAKIAISTLMWVDRQGTEQPLPPPPRVYQSPRISPDGGRVAFHVSTPPGEPQLAVLDLTRGITTRLTFEQRNMNPVWTPNGKRLIYTSGVSVVSEKGMLAAVNADGSGQPVMLTAEEVTPVPTSVSPDGKFVIGVRSSGDQILRGTDLFLLPLDGTAKADAKPQLFLDNRFTRGDMQFSPDGKWVAYESNETGRNEIYASPFPRPGGKSQVSTEGGTQPRWNRNGRELFFRSANKMIAVDVETGAAFRAGAPKMLFEKVASDYDVAPDGKRFLMLKPSATAADSTSELHVILNWFDDLRRRVPLPK